MPAAWFAFEGQRGVTVRAWVRFRIKIKVSVRIKNAIRVRIKIRVWVRIKIRVRVIRELPGILQGISGTYRDPPPISSMSYSVGQ